MKTKIIYFLICFTAVFSPACEEFIETEQLGNKTLIIILPMNPSVKLL